MTGALVGAALGIAAGLFATSQTGKKAVKDLKARTAEFYAFAAPKLKNLKNVSEAEYRRLLDKLLADYNKDGKLDKKDLQKLAREAKASWKHIKKSL